MDGKGQGPAFRKSYLPSGNMPPPLTCPPPTSEAQTAPRSGTTSCNAYRPHNQHAAQRHGHSNACILAAVGQRESEPSLALNRTAGSRGQGARSGSGVSVPHGCGSSPRGLLPKLSLLRKATLTALGTVGFQSELRGSETPRSEAEHGRGQEPSSAQGPFARKLVPAQSCAVLC